MLIKLFSKMLQFSKKIQKPKISKGNKKEIIIIFFIYIENIVFSTKIN